MRQLRMPLALLLILCFVQASQATPERRVALVIGNGAYKEAPLKNPANDARDVVATLKQLGFEVFLHLDADQKAMEQAVEDFYQSLRKGGTGLFYFAGHGVQVQGTNYLLPIGVKVTSESDVKFQGVDAGLVLGKMEDAGNGLNIVILDACRNNPFARSFRSPQQGLAKMDAPTGSLVAYSTAPGSVAADGEGKNGLYTKHLLRNMTVPGLTVHEMFMRVRLGVVEETRKAQVPWEASSLTGYFYFAGVPAEGMTPLPAPSQTTAPEKKENWFTSLFKKKEPAPAPTPLAPAPVVAIEPSPVPEPVVTAPPESADAELKALQEELRKQESEAKEAKTKAQKKAVAAEKAALKKKIDAVREAKAREEAEAKAAEEAAKAPEPIQAEVDFGDIKAKAAVKARAEAEARKKWASWQSGMKAAVAEAEKLERDKSLSVEDKTAVWQRLASRFADDNPYSEEDDKLRSRINARAEHWTRLAQKEAVKKKEADLKEEKKSKKEAAEDKAKSIVSPAVEVLTDVQNQHYEEGRRAYGNGDYVTALKILSGLARTNHGPSKYLLGIMYAEGKGVLKDIIEAERLWNSAFILCMTRAKNGDALSQKLIGDMYKYGYGIAKDEYMAIEWYMLSADNGHSRAQFALSLMYYNGIGIPKSISEAVKWSLSAAKQGLAEAQYNLGVAYANGLGVPQNLAQAYLWFSLAAAQEHSNAAMLRDKSASRMTSEQLAEAQELVAQWRPRTPEELGFGKTTKTEEPKLAELEVGGKPGAKPEKPNQGDTWRDPLMGIEFVWVPGGTYEMGCGSWTSDCYDNEKPVHKVRLDGFWLGKFEVTQGQWQRVMGNNPSYFKKGDNYPVEMVSWNDAKAFIAKLSGMGKGKFRLPTEAEWEYAASSGGRAEKYAGGNDLDRVAWYNDNSGGSTHAVGSKAPNGLGLYDMSGNVELPPINRTLLLDT